MNIKSFKDIRMTLITGVKQDWTEHAHWTTFNPTVVEYL